VQAKGSDVRTCGMPPPLPLPFREGKWKWQTLPKLQK
jgi:hypothetical protein